MRYIVVGVHNSRVIGRISYKLKDLSKDEFNPSNSE